MELFRKRNSLAGTRWVCEREDDYTYKRHEIIFTDSHNAILKGYIEYFTTGEERIINEGCTYVYNLPNVIFTNNKGTETGEIFGNTLILLGREHIKM